MAACLGLGAWMLSSRQLTCYVPVPPMDKSEAGLDSRALTPTITTRQVCRHVPPVLVWSQSLCPFDQSLFCEV
jgi:hypothetical protein